MQLAELVQDTVPSAVPPGTGGGGVGTTLHAVPFHASARVNLSEDGTGPSCPTTMQRAGPAQETPSRTALGWASFAVGSTVHDVPFHDSASGRSTKLPCALRNKVLPTAMHRMLPAQETAVSSAPPPGCWGLGLGTMVQVLPFHFSARVK